MAGTPLPEGLELKPILGTWSERPQPNKRAFRPEAGRAITRRLTTSAGFLVSFDCRLRGAAYDLFWTFYRVTLVDGSRTFAWTHPITCTEMDWQFDPAAEPEDTLLGKGVFGMRLQLIRLT